MIGTDELTWGETRDLVLSVAADPATALGADLAGWSYAASVPQIAQVLVSGAKLGRKGAKVIDKLMPWNLGSKRHRQHTAAEIARAQAQMDREVIFQ